MLPVPDEPMLASAVPVLPEASGVAFEPKWDGYRAMVSHLEDGAPVVVSRRGTSMAGAFPEIAGAAARDLPPGTTLDGELVIWHGGRLAFTRLQDRLRHRGGAGAARAAAAWPAHYVCFDVLHLAGADIMARPYAERRAALEKLFAERRLGPPWTLCPMTTDRAQAEEWLRDWAVVGVEGVMVKEMGRAYEPGVRGWRKVKHRETTETLIGAVTGTLARPGTLLLGRHDAAGRLHRVGRTTPLSPGAARTLAGQLSRPRPGHPWAGRRFSAGWGRPEPLEIELVEPVLVAEVSVDAAVDSGRYRHPVRYVRLRPDMSVGDVPTVDPGEGEHR